MRAVEAGDFTACNSSLNSIHTCRIHASVCDLQQLQWLVMAAEQGRIEIVRYFLDNYPSNAHQDYSINFLKILDHLCIKKIPLEIIELFAITISTKSELKDYNFNRFFYLAIRNSSLFTFAHIKSCIYSTKFNRQRNPLWLELNHPDPILKLA